MVFKSNLAKQLGFSILFCITVSALLTSCATSSGASQSSEDRSGARKIVGQGQINYSLADLLRKNTPLQVQGVHPNVSILVRGVSTIQGDSRPFFIIDGVRLGRSYAQADNIVDINNVKSIRVYKGLSELAVFGEDGVNGVIAITHHKD